MLVQLLKADDMATARLACECLVNIIEESVVHRDAVAAAEPAWGQRLVKLLGWDTALTPHHQKWQHCSKVLTAISTIGTTAAAIGAIGVAPALPWKKISHSEPKEQKTKSRN